jgi:drug/metabolite transporter (DMT)-like permease
MTSTVQDAVAPGRAVAAPRPGVWLTDISLVLMALIWGANFSVLKAATRWVQPLALNALRISLAAVALVVIATLARVPRAQRRDTLALLGLGVLGNCAYQVLFIEGVSLTRAGDASLVLAATPAVVALIGRARGVERVGARALGGIVLSIIGVAFVMFGNGSAGAAGSSLAGNLLIFCGCLCWALFTVLLQPYTHRVHPLRLSALTMVGGAAPFLLLALPAIRHTVWGDVRPSAFAAIVYSGLLALVVAYLLWYRGVRVLGPTRTAMYGNLQPVVALLVAWPLLGEVPTVWQGLGATGIAAGIVLTRSGRRS